MSDPLLTREQIVERHGHIEPQWLPSPTVHAQFGMHVLWSDGSDDEGNLLGFCPLHDPDHQVEASAEFNFHKGIMRCQGEPRCRVGQKPSHPDKIPRAISLVNVTMALANRE